VVFKGWVFLQSRPTEYRDSLAGDAEVVVRDRHGSISIDGEVLGFMYEVIVSRALTDDSEVVYEGEVCLAVKESGLETFLGDAGGLILDAGGFADADDLLWLKVGITADVVSVDGERDERMQWTGEVHNFPGATVGARDKYSKANLRPIVKLHCRVSWRYQSDHYHCGHETYLRYGKRSLHTIPPG
jgi:hypothetical protein